MGGGVASLIEFERFFQTGDLSGGFPLSLVDCAGETEALLVIQPFERGDLLQPLQRAIEPPFGRQVIVFVRAKRELLKNLAPLRKLEILEVVASTNAE